MASHNKNSVDTALSIAALLGLLVQGCLLQDDPADPDLPECGVETPAIRLGEPWVKRQSATNQYLGRIVWAGSGFVVTMGADSVLVSEDGVAWSKHAIPKGLNALAWSGDPSCATPSSGMIVGVGENGVILSSADGMVWTEQVSGTTNRLRAVEWTGSQFVAVGEAGTILTSPNGLAWEVRSTATNAMLRDVAWTDSMLVVAGGVILSSPDGVTWTIRDTESSEARGLNWVAWTGSSFMANNPGSRPTTGGYPLYSPDGIVWSRGVGFESDKPIAIGRQFVKLGGTSDVVGEATISVHPPVAGDTIVQQGLGEVFTPASVAWNGTRLVVVGSGGTIMTMP